VSSSSEGDNEQNPSLVELIIHKEVTSVIATLLVLSALLHRQEGRAPVRSPQKSVRGKKGRGQACTPLKNKPPRKNVRWVGRRKRLTPKPLEAPTAATERKHGKRRCEGIFGGGKTSRYKEERNEATLLDGGRA